MPAVNCSPIQLAALDLNAKLAPAAYTAEDGVTVYTAEDGATAYTAES